MKITEKHIGIALFVAASLFLATRAYPPSKEKQAAQVLRLDPPVESPDGVTFRWLHGSAGQSYRIMQRIAGTDDWWPIATGLPPSGTYTVPGFTLDRDYEYRVEPEEVEH